MEWLVDILKEDEKKAKRFLKCQRKAVGCSGIRLDRSGVKRLAFETNGPSSSNPCSNEVGKCGCAHAEPRVCLKMLRNGFEYGQFVMLCTYSPCSSCANIIVDSKLFRSVVYLYITEHDLRGIDILKRGGIKVLSAKDISEGVQP